MTIRHDKPPGILQRTPEGRAILRVGNGRVVASMIVGPMTAAEADEWQQIMALGLPKLKQRLAPFDMLRMYL